MVRCVGGYKDRTGQSRNNMWSPSDPLWPNLFNGVRGCQAARIAPGRYTFKLLVVGEERLLEIPLTEGVSQGEILRLIAEQVNLVGFGELIRVHGREVEALAWQPLAGLLPGLVQLRLHYGLFWETSNLPLPRGSRSPFWWKLFKGVDPEQRDGVATGRYLLTLRADQSKFFMPMDLENGIRYGDILEQIRARTNRAGFGELLGVDGPQVATGQTLRLNWNRTAEKLRLLALNIGCPGWNINWIRQPAS